MDSLFDQAMQHATDPLGCFARITVDTSVYDRAAVLKTAYWFTDLYYLFLQSDDTGLQVELRLKGEVDAEALEAACGEFMNRLLDQQVRQVVLSETGAVREQLVKKAFFEGAAHGNPDRLVSNESFIPDAASSVADDPLHIGRETGA